MPRGIVDMLRRLRFRRSKHYWERRYARGGSSGAGSTGRVASFKAATLNEFIRHNDVDSVIELGCGDGQQLALAEYPRYIGMDVSPTAVRSCADQFAGDATKSFMVYDPELFVNNGALQADLAISLDVIYHLVEDEVFERYMYALFGLARRFVAVFSTDATEQTPAAHVRHRAFTPWITVNLPSWELVERIENPHKGGDSQADLYIFSRRTD